MQNQAFREGKSAWDAQDRDAGRAQWAAQLFGKKGGGILRTTTRIDGQGATKRAFLGLQQGCSETKIASGGDDLRAERTVSANILSYIAIIIHIVSQDGCWASVAPRRGEDSARAGRRSGEQQA